MISLAIAQLSFNAMKGQSTATASADWNNLTSSLQIMMANSVNCTRNVTDPANISLANQTFNPAPLALASPTPIARDLTSITYQNGTTLISTLAGKNLYGAFTITKIQLIISQILVANTTFQADIHVEGTRPQGSVFGLSLFKTDVPVALGTNYVSPNATFLNCSAVSLGTPSPTVVGNVPNPYMNTPLPPSGQLTMTCPPGQVMTGITVFESGTCHHDCDLNGPPISQIQLLCSPL
jgi:hypothetical protein